jgi:hypothetical protein
MLQFISILKLINHTEYGKTVKKTKESKKQNSEAEGRWPKKMDAGTSNFFIIFYNVLFLS